MVTLRAWQGILCLEQEVPMGQDQPLLGEFICSLHERLPCWASWDAWSPVAVPCVSSQYSKT